VVFLPEGLQKLIFPDVLGAGRFARIGIPFPDVMGPFVGLVETVCGALIILGLFTRLAAIPLIIIMIVALISTKLPIWLGHDLRIFHLAQDIKRTGLWSMMHEARHLIVDDLPAEVARLRTAGVKFRNDIVTGPGGSQILLSDPSGNLVELFQPARR
jgi:hypothetical protein